MMPAVQPPPPVPVFSDSSAAGITDGSPMTRTYRAWKGSNVFFLQGRLIFGPDVKSIFLTVFLIVAPVAAFCAFVARKLLDDFPHQSGWSIMVIVIALTVFVLIVLLLTSGRDPGIVPRNAHPPEPDDDYGSSRIDSGQIPRLRLPRTKDVIVNGITLKIKYCDTCKLYRPPRCSHCSVCDNCVERFDHHCPWVGQCIGLRNYRFYFMFVSSATLLCLYIHGFCWVYIRRIMDSEGISIWKAMIKTPASIALIIYSFICVWFVGGLTAFHTYLISTNESTYENFRYRYDRQQVNPFNKGILKNFKEIFCSSIPPSKNNFRSKVPKDPSSPSSRVGDGPVGPMMRKTMGDLELGTGKAYSEADEEGSDYKGGFSNSEELSKGGELADSSLDLGITIPKQDVEVHDASYIMHSHWERRSRMGDIGPEVLDGPQAGELTKTAS
ncbi:probable protein S-acyltransferase 5 [Neltuma alba]|uniref:probable protein S-acyltransferase 5 n=1 Tax=Neltuma alba TaxID=207710 RepID=UPI0010A48B34|nr:probable protein S-acyltransferase 5 [Prosopis alba]XP_028766227.1 probable protein S-acyltransferase 5 [Prosopis alba]XP_028766228.1 probable protein S-acyltransferase 5 [Prosopis alba]